MYNLFSGCHVTLVFSAGVIYTHTTLLFFFFKSSRSQTIAAVSGGLTTKWLKHEKWNLIYIRKPVEKIYHLKTSCIFGFFHVHFKFLCWGQSSHLSLKTFPPVISHSSSEVQEVSSLKGHIRSIRAAVSGIMYPIQFAVIYIYQGNFCQPDITENPFVCSD